MFDVYSNVFENYSCKQSPPQFLAFYSMMQYKLLLNYSCLNTATIKIHTPPCNNEFVLWYYIIITHYCTVKCVCFGGCCVETGTILKVHL
jgi:hypothetical protein